MIAEGLSTVSRPERRWWAGLAGALVLNACSGPPPADPPAIASADQPFPLQLERGLNSTIASGDAPAIGALAGAYPAFAVRIVIAAATAHPREAAGIAAATAAAVPDQAPSLAAAAATANPAAAAEIAGRSAAIAPAASEAIGRAVLAALLPDERLALETKIRTALHAATPLSVDDWASATSDKR